MEPVYLKMASNSSLKQFFRWEENMRRGSFTGIASGGGPNEPLIVVEESSGIAEEEEDDSQSSPAENYTINQYLLTPWRDARKRSLPTPPCTSGITASQVRRLSERGGEGSGPSPREQAFLATLSQAPAPVPGARRHSVVTISRAPQTTCLFGRNRRESIAAFATGGLAGLSLRRDSITNQSRGSIGGGGSNSGSSFNLQLDIMDNITEAKARAKERRKLSRTQSRELTDENGSIENSPSAESVKISDRIQPKPSAPILQKKKTSDLIQLNLNSSTKKSGPGIICSNTDLKSILSPLTSSAQEISVLSEKDCPGPTPTTNTDPTTHLETAIGKKRKQLKDRSNSFDVGLLPGSSGSPSSWFTKRHQPIAKKEELSGVKSDVLVTFNNEKQKPQTTLVLNPEKGKTKTGSEVKKSPDQNQVVWDNRSGSVVDPQVLGSAIEVFLNRRSSQEPSSPVLKTSPRDSPTQSSSKGWFGGENEDTGEATATDACDSSICSTLKDLFVK